MSGLSHVMHLNKNGGAFTMASKTACGRNVTRTPRSANWEQFKNSADQCELCAASKHAELNRKADAKADLEDADLWQPVDDPDAWKAQDDAIIKANRK